MSHTDPIADMLTRIRNAIGARKKEVALPLSKVKREIARILKDEGYITDFKIDEASFPRSLVIELKYMDKNHNVIEGLKRISTPGQRIYAGVNDMPHVLDGLGVAVVSTSKGIMTGKECQKQSIGGEVLLYVW